MRKHLPLLLILLVYLVVGALYAVYTPAWQTPDEPAHYNYVRQLAAGRLPVMEAGDYDEQYRGEVVASRFAPGYQVESLTYEDWQPPLYYLLQTPVYRLSGASLLAMRLFSVALGAAEVALAYGVAGRLFAGRPWLVWTVAVFVAFLPQHVAILASVNNDSLAELVIAAILFVLIGYVAIGDWRLAIGTRPLLLLGTLLGLGFLTKGTVYLMVPVIGVALLVRFWGHWHHLLRAGLLLFAPALLLGAFWWGRNAAIYGGFDVLGKAAHDAAVVGQPRTAEWIAQYGLAETVRRFLQTTFNSFWGQFGWMALPLPTWVYRPLQLLTGLAILGLLVRWLGPRPATGDRRPATGDTHFSNPRWNIDQWNIVQSQISNPKSPIPNLQSLILITTFLVTVGLHVGYNLTFVQHQGRYLFPALIPIAAALALGLDAWLRPLARHWPWLNTLLPLGLGAGLAGLALLALFRFIVPCLSVAGC
jgi:4-amino-4-deoxy-L-arabinose transferase-like glycosyltransferase